MTTQNAEPIFDVAQLAHVEIYSPKPEETVGFFTGLLGMEETEREGQSAYLRAYEDMFHHTLKVTEARQAGMGHLALRTSSPAALERRVGAIEATGLGRGWIEGDRGHGPTYRFATPDGHAIELLYEVEPFQAPPDKRTALLNRPQKRPVRGVPVRRLDHVNLMASDVKPTREFFMDALGFRLHEQLVMNDGSEVGAWMAVTNLVHDIAVMGDRTGAKGRLHHLCYWYGYPQHLMDLADILTERDYRIEAGPGKHGITQAYFLYVFEPGGNRVELFGDAGYLIFDPNWKPIVWGEEDIDTSIIWFGSPLPDAFFVVGSPDVGQTNASEDRALVEAIDEIEEAAAKIGD